MHSFTHPIGPIPQADTYAWPGAYPIVYITDDGETLCADCVNDPSNPVHFGGLHDGWRIMARDIFYEDSAMHCAHCNKVIESAYGDPEADDAYVIGRDGKRIPWQD